MTFFIGTCTCTSTSLCFLPSKRAPHVRAPTREPLWLVLTSFAAKTVHFSLGTRKIRCSDVILRQKRVMCSLLFLGITKLGNRGPRFVEIARRRGGARVAQDSGRPRPSSHSQLRYFFCTYGNMTSIVSIHNSIS